MKIDKGVKRAIYTFRSADSDAGLWLAFYFLNRGDFANYPRSR